MLGLREVGRNPGLQRRHELAEVGRVAVARLRLGAVLSKTIQRKFADGFQHGESSVAGVRHGADQVRARPDDRAGPALLFSAFTGNGARRLQVEAARNTASRAKNACSYLIEQVVAPGDRIANGLLPRRRVARPAFQQRQVALQAVAQCRDRTSPACGRRRARWPAASHRAGGRFRQHQSGWRHHSHASRRQHAPARRRAAPQRWS